MNSRYCKLKRKPFLVSFSLLVAAISARMLLASLALATPVLMLLLPENNTKKTINHKKKENRGIRFLMERGLDEEQEESIV